MKTSDEINIRNIGEEITSLLAICLDIKTPETVRIVLRKELKKIKLIIDKILAESK